MSSDEGIVLSRVYYRKAHDVLMDETNPSLFGVLYREQVRRNRAMADLLARLSSQIPAGWHIQEEIKQWVTLSQKKA